VTDRYGDLARGHAISQHRPADTAALALQEQAIDNVLARPMRGRIVLLSGPKIVRGLHYTC
ncbi:MAG: hypothetical protein AAGC97_19250, partial [Planctomycetota bacterium]